METQSTPIQSIAYEGSGTGGTLICDGVSFNLNDVKPGLSLSVGSTKDNQLALASSGKVFPFGPLKSASENIIERLATHRLRPITPRVIAFSSGRHRSILT